VTPEQHYREAELMLKRAELFMGNSISNSQHMLRLSKTHAYLAELGHRLGFGSTSEDVQDT
jgi:hypothetical protein